MEQLDQRDASHEHHDAIPHALRLRRHRRRSLRLFLPFVLLAGLLGGVAAQIFACRAGWVTARVDGIVLAWNIEREGPGRFRFASRPLNPEMRAERQTPSAEVRIRIDKSIDVPRWKSRLAIQTHAAPVYEDDADTRWTVAIKHVADPAGLEWVSTVGSISLDPSELPALHELIDERLSTFRRSAPPSIVSGMPPADVYTPRLGTWKDRAGCPGGIRLLALAAGAAAALGVATVFGASLLHAKRQKRRLGQGRCAWCTHPLNDRLCTECGTDFASL